ncbi:hypothetical protein LEP1GSC151_5673 [Leptospira interrogans serovar Grippotyphosa str. LT2186]|uniref:Uncharacterized protein n=2 Tax=Leptospira interrogans TaxID=173 RepID=M3FL71_LEPIR|nr:hypothetical protein LEP1GSC080_1246 [Leptospira interrogans str. FPW2026]EKO24971.1 hypothetical protein LEP1GSC104_0399 [Leptospira interrogans str. UI 12621]EKO86831.1 hypothetical protein LEP1GSC009_0379 [Leptospira interrogans serovar Grippotyphosa str. Andaman]EKR44392.1 hypothetical protein LEP1GSC097_1757 [Leptospira interrogans serovar Grippotyphosa str. UI 08368]EMG08219.1 hypothetical protein LEP1GSC151_5673 [Leptospira interrogans serovar Grippotyphosa str. LT2186]EMJ49132.1 hyp
MKGKLTDLSPNSRLFLACQNAILVDVSIYTEKKWDVSFTVVLLVFIKF